MKNVKKKTPRLLCGTTYTVKVVLFLRTISLLRFIFPLSFLLEKPQSLLDEILSRYQIHSVCTPREVTVVTGRIVCGYQKPYDAALESSQSYWAEVYVGIKTLLYALLRKSQSLLSGNLCWYQNPSIYVHIGTYWTEVCVVIKNRSACISREVTALVEWETEWPSEL